MKIEYLSSSPAAERPRHWDELVDESFGAVDMGLIDGAKFNGEIRRASLGDLELDEVISDFEIAKDLPSHRT